MSIYLIAELGHNWAPDPDTAVRMVQAAADAGADAVKVQCRTLPDAIPESQRSKLKRLPWDPDTEVDYVTYREQCELDDDGLRRVADIARHRGLDFGASCWDETALTCLCHIAPPDFLKLASASTTDLPLVAATAAEARRLGIPVLISTGACTWDDVDAAVAAASAHNAEVWVAQCTSTYPADPSHLHLRAIPAMSERYPSARVGYSNHAVSIAPSIAAIGLGAEWVEVHVTLDRTMPGTDQAASFEFSGLRKLRQYADTVEQARGLPEKAVQPGESEIMAKLRRVS